MAFTLPDLPYAKDALAPHISSETLDFHHGKHHATYVKNLNGLVEGTDMAPKSLEDIIQETAGKPEKQGVFNNAAQIWNHTFYWHSMAPNGGGKPSSAIAEAIDASFGSYDKFVEEFKAAGAGQFGSGWAWLVKDTDGGLKVTKTENGVNPLCFGQTALLGCDVWEHSYYIDFRNKRPAYLQNFLDNLVNWENVASRM